VELYWQGKTGVLGGKSAQYHVVYRKSKLDRRGIEPDLHCERPVSNNLFHCTALKTEINLIFFSFLFCFTEDFMFLHYKKMWLMLYRRINIFSCKSCETYNYILWVKCKVGGWIFSVVINQLIAVLFLASPCKRNKRHLETCLINFLLIYLQNRMTK